MQSSPIALCGLLLGLAVLGHWCHGCIQLLQGCRESYDITNATTLCSNHDKIIACLNRIHCDPGYEYNRGELVVLSQIAKENHGCHNHGVRQEAAVSSVLAVALISVAAGRQA